MLYQRPLSPAWRTARSRAALVEPSSMSRRPVAMTLHKSVIYGPAIEAAQASSVPSSAMRSPLPAPSKAIRQEAFSRRPWRHHLVQ